MARKKRRFKSPDSQKKKLSKRLIEDDKAKIDAYLRDKSKTIVKCDPAYADGASRGPSVKASSRKRKSE